MVILSHRNSVDKDAAAVTIYKRRTNRLMTVRYASLVLDRDGVRYSCFLEQLYAAVGPR